MRVAQEKYLKQCYTELKAVLGQCRHCGPSIEPAQKRWEDAVHSVATYVDSIAVPKGFPPVRVGQGDMLAWGSTWEGGVFAGDSYDTGIQKWYWRLQRDDKEQWADTPVDALIACVNALERKLEADAAARTLVFTVRMAEVTCREDDHDWKFLYEGRHGSDKGDSFYECRVCQQSKRE